MNSRVAIVVFGGMVLACGTDASEAVENDLNTGGSAGSGGAGAAASGGSTGTGATSSGGTTGTGSAGTGSGGAGGTGGFDGGPVTGRRACGPSVRCNAGAICELKDFENTTNCVCDPSGHFVCFTRSLPWGPTCLPGKQCGLPDGGGGDCSNANAFCNQACQCRNGLLECSYDCRGSGPEQPGRLCDPSTCGRGEGSCRYEDGACSYSVSCPSGAVSGQCD